MIYFISAIAVVLVVVYWYIKGIEETYTSPYEYSKDEKGNDVVKDKTE